MRQRYSDLSSNENKILKQVARRTGVHVHSSGNEQRVHGAQRNMRRFEKDLSQHDIYPDN